MLFNEYFFGEINEYGHSSVIQYIFTNEVKYVLGHCFTSLNENCKIIRNTFTKLIVSRFCERSQSSIINAIGKCNHHPVIGYRNSCINSGL